VGIYRRGRIWWIDFYNQNRSRVQESSQSVHRRDAERLLNLRKSESLRGIYRRPVKVTLADFGKRYMEHAKANKRSWLRDEQMLERLQEFFGAGRQLSDIGAADVENYKLRRRASVSGSTVNRELALLKRMFNLAAVWDLYQDANPVKKVKFFREFNTGLRVLSEEEEGKFLQHATPLIQDVARFALNTGLRIGEIFSLCWSQVDMEKRILSIVAPKTGKMREVPINAEALQVLQAWSHSKRNEFVFYNPVTGRPFVDLKAGFAIACRKAGITGVSWHTLRHTFASRLVSRGVDIVTVKELLGHSTITVTMRYTHTNLESKRKAVQTLTGVGDNLVTMPATVLPERQRLSPSAQASTLAVGS
jgi:integrase